MWYKSESNIMPVPIDTVSSKKYIYLHDNIQTETREEETIYIYDECKLTRDEYAVYLAEKNRADIEYIAMMQEVEL